MKMGTGAGNASRRNGQNRGKEKGMRVRMEGERVANMRGDRANGAKGAEVG